MKNNIDIKKYDAYFHDGCLLQINHDKDSVTFLLVSSEMNPEEFEEKLPLCKDNYLRGKLHIEGVSKILLNEKEFKGKLAMQHDYAGIYNLEISTNKVFLFINWCDNGPKATIDYPPLELVIESKRVYWNPVFKILFPHLKNY